MSAKAGRHGQAAQAFDQVLAIEYSSLEAHRGLVQAHFQLGTLGTMEARYRSLRGEEPHNPFHAYGLAIALYATSTRFAEQALELLSEAEALRPELSDIPYRRGVILLDAERFLEAREAFGRAHSIADRAQYRAPLALSLYQTGDREASLEMLRGLLDLDPSPREVEMARDVAERISDPFAGFPGAARGRLERAMAWLQLADVPQNAIDMLRDILLEHPDTAMVHAVLGLAYQRIDAGGEALTHFRRATELAPDLALPYAYLGNFFHARDRYEEAHEAYSSALERNPLLTEAHAALGQMAAELGRTDDAIRHMRAWAALAPSAVKPRLLLSRSLAAAGDLPATISVLDSVLTLDESNLEAHMSLAAVFVLMHSRTEHRGERADLARRARRHIDYVLGAQPDNPTAKRLKAELDIRS